jgi:hypothetical protein
MPHGGHRKRGPDAELQVGMKHIPSRLCSAGDSAKILLMLKFSYLLFCNTILKPKSGLQVEESLEANCQDQ